MAKILKFCKVVLASASPRRRELLSDIFPSMTVKATDATELTYGRYPSRLVMKNAQMKALATGEDNALIIAADTVVFMDGRYYLKPKSEEEAREMLESLSGRTHYVYTGVCLLYKGQKRLFYDKSAVQIKRLTSDDISRYIESGSPLDKAGAYGIQDNVAVESYRGSLSNIIGLPVEKLLKELDRLNA